MEKQGIDPCASRMQSARSTIRATSPLRYSLILVYTNYKSLQKQLLWCVCVPCVRACVRACSCVRACAIKYRDKLPRPSPSSPSSPLSVLPLASSAPLIVPKNEDLNQSKKPRAPGSWLLARPPQLLIKTGSTGWTLGCWTLFRLRARGVAVFRLEGCRVPLPRRVP